LPLRVLLRKHVDLSRDACILEVQEGDDMVVDISQQCQQSGNRG
jgi:hypothetical protein